MEKQPTLTTFPLIVDDTPLESPCQLGKESAEDAEDAVASYIFQVVQWYAEMCQHALEIYANSDAPTKEQIKKILGDPEKLKKILQILGKKRVK